MLRTDLVERDVGPDRAGDAERHADPEHRAPVPLREHAADHQAEERAGDRSDLVDPERGASLVDGEGVGEDRGGVGHEHRGAYSLDGAEGDEPLRACRTVPGDERERDGREREHEEAEVVDADPAVDVAEAPEGDDECGGHEQEPEQHPEQVAHVGRVERVEADAAEDGRQRDEHDRGVDGRHRHPERGVRQCDPLVARMVLVHPAEARAHRVGLRHAGSLRQIVVSCKLMARPCRRSGRVSGGPPGGPGRAGPGPRS